MVNWPVMKLPKRVSNLGVKIENVYPLVVKNVNRKIILATVYLCTACIGLILLENDKVWGLLEGQRYINVLLHKA